MNESNTPSTASQQRLFDYIQAALALAQTIEADIMAKDRKISNKTVNILSKFVIAAQRFEKGIQLMDEVMANLNKDIN